MKGERPRVRRRKPVTCESRQLQNTGDFIKSIDILSADSKKVIVGMKTGHGNKIASFHAETRKPLGISKEDADKIKDIVFNDLMKGA